MAALLRKISPRLSKRRSSVRPGRLARASLPIHHVGVTRFSIFSPDTKSWRLTRREASSDADRYAELLFSEERMTPRCDIFCNLSAPLLQEMSEEHSYRHIVMYSDLLPQRWLRKLQEAAQRYPVLRLISVGSDRVDGHAPMTEHLSEVSGRQDAMVFAFRLDDDDLLAGDYLDQVAPLVTESHDGFAVSFADGYAGLFENGEYTDIRKLHQPLSSMGQGVIGLWVAKEKRLNLSEIRDHNWTHYGKTVLLNAQRPTFVQTRHIGQDTLIPDSRHAADPQKAKSVMLKRFNRLKELEGFEELYDSFPSLSGRVRSQGQ